MASLFGSGNMQWLLDDKNNSHELPFSRMAHSNGIRFIEEGALRIKPLQVPPSITVPSGNAVMRIR